MTLLSALHFLNPWLLLALASLPAIWLLIRAIPPRPKKTLFPPVRLLARLKETDSPPQNTPWWLLLLRMALCAVLILALAGPYWDPERKIEGDGPVLILVDNGWTAAPGWDARMGSLDRLLGDLSRDRREVYLLPTAAPPGGWPVDAAQTYLSPMAASAARQKARALAPLAWPGAPGKLAGWLRQARLATPLSSYWLSDGLTGAGGDVLMEALTALGPVTLVESGPTAFAAFADLRLEGTNFTPTLIRPPGQPAASYVVLAQSDDGRAFGRAAVEFRRGDIRAEAELSVPPDMRQSVSRLTIEGQSHAGALYALDDSMARPLVGVADIETGEQRQPLRAARFYLERALEPYAALRLGDVEALIENKATILMLPDSGRLSGGLEGDLLSWVRDGGILVRFAGPKLAAESQDPHDPDPLLPVLLRPGERAFGGALSWQKPQHLGEFSDKSPLAGLEVPKDVTVSRQILAQPDLDLDQKTWARLEDGTPLITSAVEGQGRLVLIHTSANTEWSNLALSGSFVEVLRRILPLSRKPAAMSEEKATNLAALRHMSGFGALEAPYETIGPQPAAQIERRPASAELPPGLYGSDTMTIAVNLARRPGPLSKASRLSPLDVPTRGVTRLDAGAAGRVDLALPLLLLCFFLAFADMLIGLAMRGLLRGLSVGVWLRRLGLGALSLLMIGAFESRPARAADEKSLIDYAGTMRLACVETGNRSIDQACLDGLQNLTSLLRIRTAVYAGDPVLVRPDAETLSLFPVLYWPVLEGAPPLSAKAAENVRNFIQHSGLILFDTGMGSTGPQSLPIDSRAAREALQGVTGRLDLPPLEKLSSEHVLAHSFYILEEFPGRMRGGDVWVEQGTKGQDGQVSPVIIGAHDWARSWRFDPMAAQRGLPARDRQTELALRFGVNLVIYALTGTYKADQVHIPALLQRMEE